jgi:hypothetical protein
MEEGEDEWDDAGAAADMGGGGGLGAAAAAARGVQAAADDAAWLLERDAARREAGEAGGGGAADDGDVEAALAAAAAGPTAAGPFPFSFDRDAVRDRGMRVAKALAQSSRFGLESLAIAAEYGISSVALDALLAAHNRDVAGCTRADGTPMKPTYLSATLKLKADEVARLLGQPLPEGTTATVEVEACGSGAPAYPISATSPTFNIMAAAISMVTDKRLGFEHLAYAPCAPPAGPLRRGDAYNSDHAIAVHAAAVARTQARHGADIARLRADLAARGTTLEALHLLFSLFNDSAGVGSGHESIAGVLGRWEGFRSRVLGRGFKSLFTIGILNVPSEKKPSAARARAGPRLFHAALMEMIWRQVHASHERPTVLSWRDCRGKLRVALITLEPLQVIGDLVSHYAMSSIVSGHNLFYLANGGMAPKDVGCATAPGTDVPWDSMRRDGRRAMAAYNARDAAAPGSAAYKHAVGVISAANMSEARPQLLEACFGHLPRGHAGTLRIDKLHILDTGVLEDALRHLIIFIEVSHGVTIGGVLPPEASAAVKLFAALIRESAAFEDGVNTPSPRVYNYNPRGAKTTARRSGAFQLSVLERALAVLDVDVIPVPAMLSDARRLLQNLQRISIAARAEDLSDAYCEEASKLVVDTAALTVTMFVGERYHKASVDEDGRRTTSVKFFYLWAMFQPWALRFGAPSSGSASIFERYLKLLKDAYHRTNKGADWRDAEADFLFRAAFLKRYNWELFDEPVVLADGAEPF